MFQVRTKWKRWVVCSILWARNIPSHLARDQSTICDRTSGNKLQSSGPPMRMRSITSTFFPLFESSFLLIGQFIPSTFCAGIAAPWAAYPGDSTQTNFLRHSSLREQFNVMLRTIGYYFFTFRLLSTDSNSRSRCSRGLFAGAFQNFLNAALI